jgi:hypothetical protein
MKKILILSLAALFTFSACEKEELLNEEHTEYENCEECGDHLDAYTDVHDIGAWYYEGTEDFEMILEDQWEDGPDDNINTLFHKTGGPSEAVSVYYYEEEELYQIGGAGISFGLTDYPYDLDTACAKEFATRYLFFSNDAEIGDSWLSFNWGKEVTKTLVAIEVIEVPAGEFCCKKVEIDLGHGLICNQWVSEIGLIKEEFYQDGNQEPIAEYFLVDFEEHDDCAYFENEEEEWEEEEEHEEGEEEECDCDY